MNLDANQASIREVCDAGLLAGAVTVVWQRGELLQVNEIGYRDIDAGLPMQSDTLFRIASMTKPVTVAAVMSLVDEGKLALKDPVVRWAPELADVRVLDDPHGPLDRTHPARRAILIEDLLTHTSGLAYGFSVSGPISTAYLRLPFNQGPDVWLTELAKLPLVHQPGEKVTYSHAIDLLGVIAARIDGKPFHQVLDERVLGPAGMPDTGFFASVEARRRAATMYRLTDEHELQHGVMGPPHITPPSFCNAGGGLWSTADDYLRFVRMLLGDGEIEQLGVELEVPPDRELAIKRERLRHVADAFACRHVAGVEVPAEEQRFALGRGEQAGEHLHRRALAAAVGAEETEDLAALDAEADVIDRRELAETLREPLRLDGRRTAGITPRRDDDGLMAGAFRLR